MCFFLTFFFNLDGFLKFVSFGGNLSAKGKQFHLQKKKCDFLTPLVPLGARQQQSETNFGHLDHCVYITVLICILCLQRCCLQLCISYQSAAVVKGQNPYHDWILESSNLKVVTILRTCLGDDNSQRPKDSFLSSAPLKKHHDETLATMHMNGP